MTTEKMMILDGDEMREYTEAEYAQNAKDIADALAAKAEEDAKAAIIEANKAAILEKLGITPDEAKLLLS